VPSRFTSRNSHLGAARLPPAWLAPASIKVFSGDAASASAGS
jgi:hypothetical protein